MPDDQPGAGARVVVVTGLSGAGKTTALHALEELRFFNVDNLPPALWAPTLELCRARGLERLAIVADARTRHFLGDLPEALAGMRESVETLLVYLEADDETLVRRYGLTRRSHPLDEPTLAADLREERRVLQPLRGLADVVVDTTDLSPRSLGERVRALAGDGGGSTLRLFSFGFKHGAPRDADLVLDVRGLPNPYYVPELKPLSGLEPAVAAHVFSDAHAGFYDDLMAFTRASLALARDAGRRTYTVAVGCTGGRHRSVAVVERLAHDLAADWPVALDHRDVEKGEGGP